MSNLPPRIAVNGKAFSGKTTLAKALRDAHGYTILSYTDYLKELAVDALQAAGWTGGLITINGEKERYRPFLVALGSALGFDGEKYTYRYLEKVVAERKMLPSKVVWDNVRYPEQFTVLQGMGFVLVTLAGVSEDMQQQRSGLPFPEIRKIGESLGERPLPRFPLTVGVDATHKPGEVLAETVEKLADLWTAVNAAQLSAPERTDSGHEHKTGTR